MIGMTMMLRLGMMIYCDYSDNDHMKTMTTMLILRETISRKMMMATMTSMLMIVN